MGPTAWSSVYDCDVRVGFDGEIELRQGNVTVARGDQAKSILENQGVSLWDCHNRCEVYTKLERAGYQATHISIMRE